MQIKMGENTEVRAIRQTAGSDPTPSLSLSPSLCVLHVKEEVAAFLAV